jgi:hypothetical protein
MQICNWDKFIGKEGRFKDTRSIEAMEVEEVEENHVLVDCFL